MRSQLRNFHKAIPFYKERLLLSLIGLFCLSTELLSSYSPAIQAFWIDSTALNWLFFFCCGFLFISFPSFKPVNEHGEKIGLALCLSFTLYLAWGAGVNNLADTRIRFYWIFVALAASFFGSHRYVAIFFLTAYSAMFATLCLAPAEQLHYSILSYALFAPFFLVAYFYVLSSAISSRQDLVSSKLELQRKSQELDTILNTLNAMVAFKNADNIYLKMNTSALNFFQLTAEEAEGKSLYDLLPYEIAKRNHEEDLSIIRSGKPMVNKLEKVQSIDHTKHIWLRTSKFPVFDENGKATGVVFSSEDVTEQVLSEQRLRSSEERFRMIFDYAPDGMTLVAYDSRKFIKTNRAMQDMFGYGEQDFLKMTTQDLTFEEDRGLTQILSKSAFEKNRNHYSAEKRYVHKNGQIIFCHLSVFIVTENGKPVYLIGVMKDISQTRENEKRLQQYARQLEESNQNLQEFAYAASHDLREPLRTVVSYVQLLKKSIPKESMGPDSHEFMEFVISGAKRMETQISALLEYSKVGRVTLEKNRLALADVVQNVCKSLTFQMQESAATVELADLPIVNADAYQMEALFQNLISNAIKYRRPSEPPIVKIGAFHSENEICFSISDNGIGMEPIYLEKIFAVFRRLHSSEQIPGTGVGLAICRRIVQRHGGKIWAESSPEVGTTFYFTLPVHGNTHALPNLNDLRHLI